jgi:hypothetical protein
MQSTEKPYSDKQKGVTHDWNNGHSCPLTRLPVSGLITLSQTVATEVRCLLYVDNSNTAMSVMRLSLELIQRYVPLRLQEEIRQAI